MSLGFGGGARGGRDSSVPTPVMSAIDEDDDERERVRERKRALSIVPSSSFSNFASGLAGLADAHSYSDHGHGHPYDHNLEPPLSAVSGVSASVFSDLLSEAAAGGAGAGPGAGLGGLGGVGGLGGIGVGDELSPEELQRKDPLATQVWRLYARTKANLPHAQRMENLTWRMMGMALRRKIQLEAAQMQARHHQHQHQQHQQQQHPHNEMQAQMQMRMQMKEEHEEHKFGPVDKLMDVPRERGRGRRTQKFGGAPAIPGLTTSMGTTSKAKMRVEGFEMPDEADSDGCVFLFLFLFLHFSPYLNQ